MSQIHVTNIETMPDADDIGTNCVVCNQFVSGDCRCRSCNRRLHCFCAVDEGFEGHGAHYLCSVLCRPFSPNRTLISATASRKNYHSSVTTLPPFPSVNELSDISNHSFPNVGNHGNITGAVNSHAVTTLPFTSLRNPPTEPFIHRDDEQSSTDRNQVDNTPLRAVRNENAEHNVDGASSSDDEDNLEAIDDVTVLNNLNVNLVHELITNNPVCRLKRRGRKPKKVSVEEQANAIVQLKQYIQDLFNVPYCFQRENKQFFKCQCLHIHVLDNESLDVLSTMLCKSHLFSCYFTIFQCYTDCFCTFILQFIIVQ